MKYSWCRQTSCLLGVLRCMHMWATVGHHDVYLVYVDYFFYCKLPVTGCRPSDIQSTLGWKGWSCPHVWYHAFERRFACFFSYVISSWYIMIILHTCFEWTMNRILGLRMGPHVLTPKFFTISGDPGRVIYQNLGMRKSTFLKKAFSRWTWDSKSRPTTHGLAITPFVKALLVRWATGKRLTNRPKLSHVTLSFPPDQRDSWSSYGAVRAYSEVLL